MLHDAVAFSLCLISLSPEDKAQVSPSRMDPLSPPELSPPEPDFSESEFEQAGLLSGTELETAEVAVPRHALPEDQNQVRAQSHKNCTNCQIMERHAAAFCAGPCFMSARARQ